MLVEKKKHVELSYNKRIDVFIPSSFVEHNLQYFITLQSRDIENGFFYLNEKMEKLFSRFLSVSLKHLTVYGREFDI